ncbi:hydroxyacylglutathione hydrolase [Radiomyces spectabilis]|uniref:hydroxyacylglutathione hydrolase n=1 Tax=Radiomyces spectabilis TaxID=64574 RepID=UPI00221EE56D|nr:hydroxyacylglutathione hydrolase [Radiomyces spectabilis]KAI8374341.1 hydroxyacylglutathione hydrolase [Radiomyces spectabilis]
MLSRVFTRAFSTSSTQKMIVKPVPCFSDNYAYLLLDESSKKAAAVDPVEPNKVLDALKEYPDYQLVSILTTHHHADHAGGNKKMLQLHQDLKCYGGSEQVQGVTDIVRAGDKLEIGHLQIQPMPTAGHTMDHVCYHVKDKTGDAVFTGDCLFSSGCGRFFEGSPSDMWKALSALMELPDETKVYFGHEYTRANLKFARTVEPDNKEMQEKWEWAQKTECTTPSTIKNEKLTNPFLRVEAPSVRQAVLKSDKPAPAQEVLGLLRKMKDRS